MISCICIYNLQGQRRTAKCSCTLLPQLMYDYVIVHYMVSYGRTVSQESTYVC